MPPQTTRESCRGKGAPRCCQPLAAWPGAAAGPPSSAAAKGHRLQGVDDVTASVEREWSAAPQHPDDQGECRGRSRRTWSLPRNQRSPRLGVDSERIACVAFSLHPPRTPHVKENGAGGRPAARPRGGRHRYHAKRTGRARRAQKSWAVSTSPRGCVCAPGQRPPAHSLLAQVIRQNATATRNDKGPACRAAARAIREQAQTTIEAHWLHTQHAPQTAGPLVRQALLGRGRGDSG